MATYRSGFERKVAASLNSRGHGFKYESVLLGWTKKQRITKHIRSLHKLPIDFKAYTYHMYTADFELNNGILIEAKGRFTPAERTKMLAVVKANPDKDIRMLFQRNNKLNKTYPTYMDWCKSHNIKCHEGYTIPEKWLKEK